MGGVFFNFITRLLFLASAGLLGYSLVLLILSRVRRAQGLRVRAFWLAIGPLIYIVLMFSLFAFGKRRFYREVYPSVAGTYAYTSDTLRFFILLKTDSTYVFREGRMVNSGFWSIDPSSYLVRFYNRQRQEGAHTTWRDSAGTKTLVFMRNGQPLALVKLEMPKKAPEKR